MPVDIGARTATEAAIATQASAILPPSSRARMPASAVRGCSHATAPRVLKTVDHPRSWDVSPVDLSSLPHPVCNFLHSLSASRKGIVAHR